MEQSKVDMFLAMNSGNFRLSDLATIKSTLEKLDDDKFYLVQGTEFQKPDTIFLISILLGWERFWLNDIALGLLKLLTLYGCFVWWIVDIFTAKERTYKHNLNLFNQAITFV